MSLIVDKSLIQQQVLKFTDRVIERSKDEDDREVLERIHAEELTELMIDTIRRLRITIPTGLINVIGPGINGPIISTNPSPIILELNVD